MPRSSSVLAVLLLLAACRIEKHVPAGPVQDEEAIRSVILRYVRGALQGDSAAVSNALGDSVVVLRQDRDGWHRTVGAVAWSHRTAAGTDTPGGEPTRVEVRQDGDVASAWASSRELATSGTLHFQLRRVDGTWEIVFLAIPATPLTR
jgi:hypothetical protein